MTARALAPRARAHRRAAPAGGGSGVDAGLRAGPAPLRVPERVSYAKGVVFDICAALAEAEALLSGAGHAAAARRLARVFELAEAGLAG